MKNNSKNRFIRRRIHTSSPNFPDEMMNPSDDPSEIGFLQSPPRTVLPVGEEERQERDRYLRRLELKGLPPRDPLRFYVMLEQASYRNLTRTQKDILRHLFSYDGNSSEKRHWVYPRVATMAKRLGMHRNTVGKAIKELIAMRRIKRRWNRERERHEYFVRDLPKQWWLEHQGAEKAERDANRRRARQEAEAVMQEAVRATN